MKKVLLSLLILSSAINAQAAIDCTNNMYREARIQAQNRGSAVRIRLQDSHLGWELEQAIVGEKHFSRWIAVELNLPGCHLTGKLMNCSVGKAHARISIKVFRSGEGPDTVIRTLPVTDLRINLSLASDGEPVKLGDKPVTIRLSTLNVTADMNVHYQGKTYPLKYNVFFPDNEVGHAHCKR